MGKNSCVHRMVAGVVLAIGLASGGCGTSERPKTIPISGLVTIDGKEPGEGGKLFFTPVSAAEGYALRPASGSFNAQGSYRVMSWTPDDGLVPGHYTVSVLPANAAKSAIPAKYHQSATSGLQVSVPSDQGNVEFNVEVVTN